MVDKIKPIRVRLAPSPTGPLHIGTARTALFNWLFAKQHKGVFVLRIEDTDIVRSDKKYELEIMEGLKWLGLEWDEGPSHADQRRLPTQTNAENDLRQSAFSQRESAYRGNYGPYRQSERGEIYGKYLKKLLEEEKAYFCYCTKEELEAERQAMLSQSLPPKYSGHCRDLKKPPKDKEPQVIRFKMPEVKVKFKDLIRGTITFDASLFGDITIAKDVKNPLYNFAVVVDDEEMKISHVIRGEEHLSNTPKQILFQKALGFSEPAYAHMPLILNADRSKLSKRYVETSLLDYKKQGYLPEAIVNFSALLGWHSKTDQEIFSREELIKEFDIKRVQKAGAVFDPRKLDWLQKKHFDKLSNDEIIGKLEPILKENDIKTSRSFLTKVVGIERERIKTLNEFIDLAGFFFKLPDYKATLLAWQNEDLQKVKSILKEILDILSSVMEFKKDTLQEVLLPLIEKEGRGPVLWPLRAALSGLPASPDPLEIGEILGKEEVLKRLGTAVKKIDNSSGNK